MQKKYLSRWLNVVVDRFLEFSQHRLNLQSKLVAT